MRALAALAALVVLAGCTSQPAPAPAGASPPQGVVTAAGTVIPWGLEECQYIIGVIRFDPALAQDLLPPGFTFGQGDGLPFPAEVAPLSQATLGVEAFQCARGAGLNGTVEPLSYGSFYFNVIPPENLSKGQDAGHFLKFDVLVPDEPRRAAIAATGATVHAGEVTVTPGPLGLTATMTMADVGEVRYSFVPSQPPDASRGFELAFREFTPATNGLVLWDGQATSSGLSNGQGLLEVPAGSLPARLGGGTQLRVGMVTGTFTFANATTTLPPAR